MSAPLGDRYVASGATALSVTAYAVFTPRSTTFIVLVPKVKIVDGLIYSALRTSLLIHFNSIDICR